MISRTGRAIPHHWSLIAVALLGVAATAAMGLLVGGSSLVGAILIVALVAMPAMIMVEGAPLWAFLGLFPLVWQAEFGPLNGLNILAATCIVTWAIGVLAKRQPSPFPLTMIDLGVGAFFLVSLLSILTQTTERADWYLQIYLLNAGLYLVARSVATRPASLRVALWVFAGGTTVAAVGSLIDYASGVFIQSQGLDRLGQEGIGINNYAAVLLAGTAVALGLAIGERQAGRQLLLWSAVALLMAAVVLSKSRGAFVGQAAMVGAGLLLVRHGSQRVILALPATVLGLLLLPGIAQRIGLQDYAQRMHDMLLGGGVSNSPRVYLWEMALEGYRDNPLTGVGIGNFTRPDIWFQYATSTSAPPWVVGPADVHSFFLGTLVDVGIIGAAPLFTSIALVALGIARVLRRGVTASTAGLVYGVSFGTVAYFTAITLLPAQTLALPFILLGLGAALPRAAAFHLAREGTSEEQAGEQGWRRTLGSLSPALQFQGGSSSTNGREAR